MNMFIIGSSFFFSLLLPFLVAPPLWSIGAILYAAFISPIFSIIGSALFEGFGIVKRNGFNAGYLHGAFEGLITIIITTSLLTNQQFLYAVILSYSSNQIGRVHKYRWDKDASERKQLIGYISLVLIWFLSTAI